MQPSYLTMDEVGQALGVSAMRARQIRSEGGFPNAVKRGRQWFAPQSDVDAYQKERKPVGYPQGKPRKQPVEGGE